jgi:hypothetical protein
VTRYREQQCTRAGFLLCYGAVMGALICAGVPLLEGYRRAVFEYILLPAGLCGAALITIAKLNKHEAD